MIRKIKSADCEEVRKICIEEPGYECERSLIAARVRELDESREAVFVAEREKCQDRLSALAKDRRSSPQPHLGRVQL